jgi:hypothetical protein
VCGRRDKKSHPVVVSWCGNKNPKDSHILECGFIWKEKLKRLAASLMFT